MSDEKFSYKTEAILNGLQAAEFLGVKIATLYAYVSRGLLESVNSSGGRERGYRMLDLLRLRKTQKGVHLQADRTAAEWTGPLIKSAITEIRPDGHYYRGESAIKLAESDVPFESVAELLWGQAKEVRERRFVAFETKSQRFLKKFNSSIAKDSDFLDSLKALISMLELSDARHTKLDSADSFKTARNLIATMSLSLDRSGRHAATLKFAPISKIILRCLTGSKSNERAQALNRALVLCADHELNASTLAARVAASCDAPLYSCLLSALGTFSGDLHGARSRQIEDLVRGSMHYASVSSWFKQYSRECPVPPGFGMHLYPEGDPRGKSLLTAATQINSRSATLKQLVRIIEYVEEQTGQKPNVDCGLAGLSFALELPVGSATGLFAISRTAGWVAHAVEQRLYGGMIRPRARYIGR